MGTASGVPGSDHEEVASVRSDFWEKLTSLAIVHVHVGALQCGSTGYTRTGLCRRPMRDHNQQ